MTEMVLMPIYGKNPLKISSPEPRNIGPWNLVFCICDSRPTKVIQMMILIWQLTFLGKGHSYSFLWEKYWKVHFSRTTEGWCILFGADTLLTKNMAIYQCQVQWVTFDLCFKVTWIHFFKWLVLCNSWTNGNRISHLASWGWGN